MEQDSAAAEWSAIVILRGRDTICSGVVGLCFRVAGICFSVAGICYSEPLYRESVYRDVEHSGLAVEPGTLKNT